MPASLTYATPSRDGAVEGNLVVRRGRSSDAAALSVFAALDSARPLTGLTIVAENGGRLVAAISLHDGRVVADPFVPPPTSSRCCGSTPPAAAPPRLARAAACRA